MHTTTLFPVSTHRSNWRFGFILTLLLIACFALTPMAQAVGPDTDGTIPGANNGEAIGALISRTTGVWNSGTGFEALKHLTAGNQNTATGLRALTSDTNGGFNTATGVLSLFSNTTGFFNSATGAYSLANNVQGNYNTANGYGALYRNTASYNTATGFGALFSNSTGISNTANGYLALNRNTTGIGNTANGNGALYSNTTGIGNTANGNGALSSNTTGIGNAANGYFALANNTTGSSSTGLGFEAGVSVTTASNVIAIGVNGANVSNSCFIGNIRDVQTANADAIPVLIDSGGQLGTVSSSRRFKKEIRPMDSASEAILGLKPVTFHYKTDAKGIPQFGLIAEEVAEVNPDLVVRDENGEIYTVRYDAVNAMLLNEFLKEHRKMEEQQKQVDALTAQLKQQAVLIQKVSDNLDVTRSTRQVVANEQ